MLALASCCHSRGHRVRVSPETIRPVVLEPLIRLFGVIHIAHGTVEPDDLIRRLVEQRVLLIGTLAHEVGDGLDVVGDLLVDDVPDAVELSVLEAELVPVVGVDLQETMLTHRKQNKR